MMYLNTKTKLLEYIENNPLYYDYFKNNIKIPLTFQQVCQKTVDYVFENEGCYIVDEDLDEYECLEIDGLFFIMDGIFGLFQDECTDIYGEYDY